MFRSTPVTTPPSYISSEVAQSAKELAKNLKIIKNTAAERNCSHEYVKTKKFANKLAKSAEKGRLTETMENLDKLHKHSNRLLSRVGNVFNQKAITAIKAERRHIGDMLMNNGLSLRDKEGVYEARCPRGW